MKVHKKLLIVGVFLTTASSLFSQTQFNWNNAYEISSTNALEEPIVEIIPGMGFVVGGNFLGDVTIGTNTYLSSGGFDFYLIGYDFNGTELWSKTYGGGNDEFIEDICFGNGINISGYYNTTANIDGFNLSGPGDLNIFIANLQPNNGFANNAYNFGSGGLFPNYAHSITATGNNVIITGAFTQNLTLGTFTLSSATSESFYISSIDMFSGNVNWAVQESGLTTDYSKGNSISIQGNDIVVGGQFEGNFTLGGNSFTSNGMNDFFVAKYDFSGNLMWIDAAGGPGNDAINDVNQDYYTSEVILTGNFTQSFSHGPFALSGNNMFRGRVDDAGNWLNLAEIGNDAGSTFLDNSGNSLSSDLERNSIEAYGLSFGDSLYLAGGAFESVGSTSGIIYAHDYYSNDIFIEQHGLTVSSIDHNNDQLYAVGTFNGTESFGGTTLTSSTISVFVAFGEFSRTPVNSLVGKFLFDDGYLGDSTNYHNASGVFQNNFDQDGNADKAINVSFTSSSNPSSLSAGTENRDISNEITITAWIRKTTTSTSESYVVNKYSNSTSGYRLGINFGFPVFEIKGVSTASLGINGTTNMNDANWHFLAATCDQNGLLTLWVDGVKEGEFDYATPISGLNNSLDLKIGDEFQGDINDIEIYNTALDSTALSSIYGQCIPTTSTITEVACDNYTAPDGQSYNTSGVYTSVISNNQGCDSTITINLTINNNSSSSISPSACSNYIAPDGQSYNSSGVYTAVIANSEGCDSTITINLTITNIDNTTSLNGETITSNEAGASYQWLDCDNGYSPISGETNQSYTALSNGNYAVSISNGNCTDTSACENINTLNIDYHKPFLFEVFPNPSTGNFTIKTDNEPHFYRVMNIIGEEIAHGILPSFGGNIDLTRYGKGVYFIVIDSETVKLIIK